MRLRVVHAQDAREAITRIRADLGEDALVLATRQTDSGISVTAAIDGAVADDLSAVLSPADDGDAVRKVGEALAWHGVAEAERAALLRAVAPAADNGPLSLLANLLAQAAQFAPISPVPGRRLMLIGAHGAGKTATAARLVVEAVLAGTEHRLICADPARAAAEAQLQALVAPLGQTPTMARDAADLTRILHDERRWTIIDSSGLNPFRGEELARLAALVQAARAEPVAVIPAGLAAEDAAEIAATFAALGATRMIITKLDSARRLGGLLAASAAGLALAGATIAPEIGRPLLPLTALVYGAAMLMRRAVPGAWPRCGSGRAAGYLNRSATDVAIGLGRGRGEARGGGAGVDLPSGARRSGHSRP
jgi:flagellar biosynthesis protein FlhF